MLFDLFKNKKKNLYYILSIKSRHGYNSKCYALKFTQKVIFFFGFIPSLDIYADLVV